MDITGLPLVKLMKTYLSGKAHKESKLTHLRNFDNFAFLYITKKQQNPPNETDINVVCGYRPTHIRILQQIHFNKIQQMTAHS